jgi:hypothetical protein
MPWHAMGDNLTAKGTNRATASSGARAPERRRNARAARSDRCQAPMAIGAHPRGAAAWHQRRAAGERGLAIERHLVQQPSVRRGLPPARRVRWSERGGGSPGGYLRARRRPARRTRCLNRPIRPSDVRSPAPVAVEPHPRATRASTPARRSSRARLSRPPNVLEPRCRHRAGLQLEAPHPELNRARASPGAASCDGIPLPAAPARGRGCRQLVGGAARWRSCTLSS